MAFLGERNRAMANVLRQWGFKGLQNDVLEVERGRNPFSASYLDDPERLARFTQWAGEFFGPAVRVRIKGDRNPPAKPPGEENSKTGPSEPPVRQDLPQPVQDVLQIFQGELREEAPPEPEDAKGPDAP